mgnify:CR=1 FL=1
MHTDVIWWPRDDKEEEWTSTILMLSSVNVMTFPRGITNGPIDAMLNSFFPTEVIEYFIIVAATLVSRPGASCTTIVLSPRICSTCLVLYRLVMEDDSDWSPLLEEGLGLVKRFPIVGVDPI